MLNSWWLLIAELLLIFFTSKHISNALYSAFFGLSRSRTLSSYLLFTVFFPGVLIHELGHYLMARLLFVPVHEFNLIPRHEEDSVQLGSVLISKSDPIRRFLIGVAPVVIGIVVLYLTVRFGIGNISLGDVREHWIQLIVFSYIIFVTANTMFSSKKDMEGALFLAFVLMGILGVLYVFGVPLAEMSKNIFASLLTKHVVYVLTSLLIIPSGINLVLFSIIVMVRRGRTT